MKDTLKKLVTEHRPEFDSSEPGKALWSKIDARMELKQPSRLSSKWLSKFKYLAFGLSVLIMALFFIGNNFTSSSASQSTADKGELANKPTVSGVNSSLNHLPSQPGERNTSNEVNNVRADRPESHPGSRDVPVTDSKLNAGQLAGSGQAGLLNRQGDSLLSSVSKNEKYDEVADGENMEARTPAEALADNATKTKTNSVNETRESGLVRNGKKAKLFIPETPDQTNTYSATLYEGSSFRSLLRAYKFPGKFRLDKDGDITTVKTISCSRLEQLPNVRAVWLKGKTDKEIILNIKRKFRNIVLIKSDGRKLKPEAISHYYRGLGVITEYKGRYFSLLFTNKVELILFFKDAQVGDRIVIDGIIESVIQAQP